MKIQLMVSESNAELIIKPYTGSNGLFSSVVPNSAGKNIILQIAKHFGYEPDADSLHCTVMFSKSPANEAPACDGSKVFRAKIAKAQFWGGHNDKGYLTLGLECPDLSQEHQRLKDCGCIPTFEPYNPHITLWSGLDMSDELAKKIESLDCSLIPEIELSGQTIGDLED